MRERIAKLVAAGLVALIVLLAALFARRQNPQGGSAARESVQGLGELAGSPRPDDPLVARGRAIFDEQSCLRCHALEGSGNPRSPLDGVGARLPPSQLRAWVTANPSVRGSLSSSAIRAKERVAALPAEDVDELVAFLASLR